MIENHNLYGYLWATAIITFLLVLSKNIQILFKYSNTYFKHFLKSTWTMYFKYFLKVSLLKIKHYFSNTYSFLLVYFLF